MTEQPNSSALPLRIGYAAILLERLPKQDLSKNQEYAPPGTRSWVAQVVSFLQELDEMTALPETVARATLRCEKCGSEDVRTFWHAGPWGGRSRPECSYGSIVKHRGEHLHRHCQGCHFEWADAVLPAEAVA